MGNENFEMTNEMYTADSLARTLGIKYNQAYGLISFLESIGVLTHCGFEQKEPGKKGKRRKLYELTDEVWSNMATFLNRELADGPVAKLPETPTVSETDNDGVTVDGAEHEVTNVFSLDDDVSNSQANIS